MSKQPKPFYPPFGVGDVVRYVKHVSDGVLVGDGKTTLLYPDWKLNQKHTICEIVVNGVNDYEYSTNQGAWIPHQSFELVHHATARSIRQVLNN